MYLLVNPVAAALRGLALTPERALVALATAALLLPLTYACHVLLRRGAPARRTALALAGRVVALGFLVLAAELGLFGSGEGVVLRALAPTYAVLEIVLGAYYAASGAPLPAACFESLCVGWILAAIFPMHW